MSKSKFQIREFRSEDIGAVLRLHHEALKAINAWIGSGKWDSDLQDIERAYLKNGGAFLIGTVDGQIVAMGALRIILPEVGEIKRMRVSPDFQRRGFGQAILTTLEKEALSRGCRLLVLDTTVRQVAAQNVYLKNGYREIRRVKEGFLLETIFYEKSI